jgi:hypothetical protein
LIITIIVYGAVGLVICLIITSEIAHHSLGGNYSFDLTIKTLVEQGDRPFVARLKATRMRVWLGVKILTLVPTLILVYIVCVILDVLWRLLRRRKS